MKIKQWHCKFHLLLLLFVLLVSDLLSKHLVKVYIPLGQEHQIIPNFLYLTHVQNQGAAWGVLHNTGWGIHFLSILSLIAICFCVYVLGKREYGYLQLPIVLVISGAVGNLVERVYQGYVTDFIGVWLFNYRYPIFNVADCLVVIGALILVFMLIKDSKSTVKEDTCKK